MNKAKSVRRPPGFLKTLWRIYKNDTMLEWKSPIGIISSLLFSLILATIYNFSMLPGVFRDTRNLYGIMLATLFFSSTLISGRNIHSEKEGGALRVILLAPADSAGYFMGKVLALWQLQTLFSILYIPVYFVLLAGNFSVPGGNFFLTGFLLPLGFLSITALSLSALGIMLSYVAAGNRLREIVLPLLLLPAALPVFLLAAGGLESILADIGKNTFSPVPLLILLAPAALYCSIGSLLYYTLAADE